MVVPRRQAALSLAREIKAVVPLVLDCDVRAVGEDDERARAYERLDADASRYALYGHTPAALGCAVVVAVIDERGDLERDGRPSADDRILRVSRFRAGLHPHAFLDERVGTTPGPHRRCAVEHKAFEVTMARWIYGAVGPPVCEERSAESVVVDKLVELANEKRAADWGRKRRHQKAVVASCEQSGNRSRREAADLVRTEPLLRLRRRQASGDVTTEVDDHRSTTCTACPSGSLRSTPLPNPSGACGSAMTPGETRRKPPPERRPTRPSTFWTTARRCQCTRSLACASIGNGRPPPGARYSSSSTPGPVGARSVVMRRRAPKTLFNRSCSGP